MSTKSPCLDVQCQFPWGLLHFNLFIPTTTETRSKSVSANELMLTESMLCTWHFSINYCTTTHTHTQSVFGHQPRRDGLPKLYILCDKTWKLLKGKRKLWKDWMLPFLYKILPFYSNFRDCSLFRIIQSNFTVKIKNSLTFVTYI